MTTIMNDSQSTNFQYIFYFLLRTYRWQDNQRVPEPPLDSERGVLKNGLRIDDKRLFRRDVVRGELLENWPEQLQQSWHKILQVYATAFKDKKQAHQYCQNALLGVAILILEDGNNLQQHKVTIATEESSLNFVYQQDDALFRINHTNFDKTAECHLFWPVTPDKHLFLENLQLHLDTERLPYLAPLQDIEAAPNTTFLVCGLCYGGGDEAWSTTVNSVLSGVKSKKFPLLSTLFTRLLVRQWQFTRIDDSAQKIRDLLQMENAYYADYASDEIQPNCARTRILEGQLQDMHSLNIRARFVLSRIHGALITLEINGNNLVKRLEQIRQEVNSTDVQFQYHPEPSQKISWASAEDIPVLALYSRSIKALQNHQGYVQQQIEYLEALRDKWNLYLNERKTRLGEHLNTLITVFIFLLTGTGAVTLNVHKGFVGLNFEDPRIYLTMIVLFLSPLLWQLVRWTGKALCCWLNKPWFKRIFCQPLGRMMNVFLKNQSN